MGPGTGPLLKFAFEFEITSHYKQHSTISKLTTYEYLWYICGMHCTCTIYVPYPTHVPDISCAFRARGVAMDHGPLQVCQLLSLPCGQVSVVSSCTLRSDQSRIAWFLC